MAEKVLKLHIVVDEDGSARRAAGELEAKVQDLTGVTKAQIDTYRAHAAAQAKQVAIAADHITVTKAQVDSFVRQSAATVKVAADTTEFDKRTQLLTKSSIQLGQSLQVIDPRLGAVSRGMMAVSSSGGLAAGAIAGIAAAGVGELLFLKKSVEVYAERTGLMDKHAHAIEGVKGAWERLFFVTGEGLLKNNQDFTGWLSVVEEGLILLGTEIRNRIEEQRLLLSLLSMGLGIDGQASSDRPGRRGIPEGYFGDSKLPGPSPWTSQWEQDSEATSKHHNDFVARKDRRFKDADEQAAAMAAMIGNLRPLKDRPFAESWGATEAAVLAPGIPEGAWYEELPGILEQEVIPAIDAVGSRFDALTSDVEQFGAAAMQVFTIVAQSAEELLAGAAMDDYDAERNLQRGDPMGVGFLQRQSAAKKRKRAFDLSLGFADGGLVPSYFARGGLARGGDTVPAMLSPGELVLNIAQQRRVAGAMGGVTFGPGSIVIHANGDADLLAQLTDKVQRKLSEIGERVS